jgi:hypothetical protein
VRHFAGKHRRAPAGRDDQSVQVAKGVHHADDAQPGEQENQRVAERQVVVDGAEQHDDQASAKSRPPRVGQDENAPLAQAQGRGAVALPAKQRCLRWRQTHG